MPQLELDGLTRRYGSLTALDQLSFSVSPGHVTGFLGPNGAGKTTTMRAVFGLTALDAGTIRWDGAPVRPPQRRRFGYLPEERGLYPGMRIGEQVEYFGRLHGMSAAAAAAGAKAWLERLGLADRAADKVETLLQGNQQRVQLAVALVYDPDLLILDEPLSGLDPAGIDAMSEVLTEQARAGKCVLLSSHQLDLVENLCQSVVIIDHGRLVASGDVDDLTTRGRRRLVVRVAGDRDGDWARALPGVTLSEVDAGAVRLVLDATADSQRVLAAAMAAGPVTEFTVRRRSLSEVFREEVSRPTRPPGRRRGHERAQPLLPYLIIIAALGFVVLRRYRRSGSRPRLNSGTLIRPPEPGATPMRLLPLPGDVGLVAARELRERLRGRAFRIGTLLILAVIAAAIIIPAVRGDKVNVQRVGVVGALSAPLRAAVVADGSAANATVTLVAEASRTAAESDLRGGLIDVAIIDSTAVVTDKPVTADPAAATAQLANAAARTVATANAVRSADLTPAQAAALAAARSAPVSSLQPAGPGGAQRTTSVIGLLLVFFLLTQYNTWTLIGVLEEKSSRVVEVLLGTVPAVRLLAGKVLGIGLTVFVQAGLAVVVALSIAHATHSDVLHGTTTLSIAATLVWLVLGYAFYSWVYAAAGATVSRQDQVQSLAFPLALPVIFGYIVSLSAATSGNPSLLVHVLAYLPLTAPLAMPTLVGLGAVSWWQFAASAVISLACTVGVARVAAGVYRRAILQTGRRVRLREALARN